MKATSLRRLITAGLLTAASACSGGNPRTTAGEANGQVSTGTAPASQADIVAPLLALGSQDNPALFAMTWGADVIQRTRDGSADRLPSTTPDALLQTLARAEDTGDVATFARGLNVEGEGQMLWGVCMLIPQANRRLVDMAIAHAREKLGADSDIEGALRNSRVKGLLSQASFRERPMPGFYLPNGAFMMKVIRTEAGWRVSPASQAELLAIPARNLPSMITYSAYLASVYQGCDQPAASLPAVLAQASATSATVAGLVNQSFGLGTPGGGCPQCGQRTLFGGHCSTCGLDLTGSR